MLVLGGKFADREPSACVMWKDRHADAPACEILARGAASEIRRGLPREIAKQAWL